MKVFNTFSRNLEDFTPLNPPKVTFYQCGPTVYWIQHIGNLRAMVWADLISRTLKYLGFSVTFVRNYTDVGHLTSDADFGEDKMEKSSKREGLSPKAIADKYIRIFENDTKALNILPPDKTPRATEYIPQMIEMIKTLIEKKHAYVTDNAIYFDISTFPGYNKLNKQKIEENLKGAGKGQIEDTQKKHFADFALWFFKKGPHINALQTWLSPWGEGFPGWHIECSVMSKSLLGKTLDIHMGGVEHIPVHHTNEIAQSESANGVKFVDYWIHNEHLIINDKKMAKSEGSGLTLEQIKSNGYNPLNLRYLFLNAHYRSKQNFTWEALAGARDAYQKLKAFVISLRKQTQRSELSEEKLAKINEYRLKFENLISNDFQIPQALAITWEMLKSNIPSTDKLDLLLDFDKVFGLNLHNIEPEVIPADIERLKNEYDTVRNAGNFSEADKKRRVIEAKGFSVQNTNSGTIILKKN